MNQPEGTRSWGAAFADGLIVAVVVKLAMWFLSITATPLRPTVTDPHALDFFVPAWA